MFDEDRHKFISGAALRCSAGDAPRVGQPGWACGHPSASPALPLEGALVPPSVRVCLLWAITQRHSAPNAEMSFVLVKDAGEE